MACTNTLQTPCILQNTDFSPRPIIPAALYHVPAQRVLVLLFFTMVTSYPNVDGGVLLNVTVTELTSVPTVSTKRIRQSSPLTSGIRKRQATWKDERLLIFFFFSSDTHISYETLFVNMSVRLSAARPLG